MHLPVVDPVLVFGLAFRDLTASDVRKKPQFFKAFPDPRKQRLGVGPFLQVKDDVRQTVVRQFLRHHFAEHPLGLRVEDRLPVADLHVENVMLREKLRDQVLRFRCGMDRKTQPLHS